jgi:hypothetical protein
MTPAEANQHLDQLEVEVNSGRMSIGAALARAFLTGAKYSDEFNSLKPLTIQSRALYFVPMGANGPSGTEGA